MLRTLPFLTTARASAEREHVSAGGTGGDWNVWAGHRAWTTVRLTFEDGDDDLPPDTPVLAYREIFVEGTAHGRDGWTGPGPRLMASVKLTRTVGGPWRVADVRVVEEVLPPAARPLGPGLPLRHTARTKELSEASMSVFSRRKRAEETPPSASGPTAVEVRVRADGYAEVDGLGPSWRVWGRPPRRPCSTTFTASP